MTKYSSRQVRKYLDAYETLFAFNREFSKKEFLGRDMGNHLSTRDIKQVYYRAIKVPERLRSKKFRRALFGIEEFLRESCCLDE